MLRQLLLAALCLAGPPAPARACQLPSEWRPLSEGCRAELAETIVYARVLALHPEAPGLYNHLPWQYHAGQGSLFYSAEVEMLCDQAWGSMLEVPAGSRLNLTGLGYFSCHSHTVVQDYSYFFFLRMDENYNLFPHGVNFQDAIFPDTQENRRMFSSLFQFSNCSQGQQLATFSSDWEIQEDNRQITFREGVYVTGEFVISNPSTAEKPKKPGEIWELLHSMKIVVSVFILLGLLSNLLCLLREQRSIIYNQSHQM
ncbi:coiled-coil domain-containing protein 3 isoform X2 [Symphalangus syndactylus]|uniref:coiled-coil domain-containing protein 3 isoform X2 n=1 Tax=Symphalangus syndactylus TaxID=9590 RepID=UPI0024420F8E|nr:coiled-coil domain-containing protein 3 isoform X2 [Symphalangus syndactylus]